MDVVVVVGGGGRQQACLCVLWSCNILHVFESDQQKDTKGNLVWNKTMNASRGKKCVDQYKTTVQNKVTSTLSKYCHSTF